MAQCLSTAYAGDWVGPVELSAEALAGVSLRRQMVTHVTQAAAAVRESDLRQQVDEEGCGAVIGACLAATVWRDDHG